MRTPGATTEDREAYWTNIIGEARSCAEGVSAYCAAKGLSPHTYYYWFKRLRPAHPEWQTDLPAIPPERSQKTKTGLRVVETEVDEERPRRRKFTAAYKEKILKEADASTKGQVAALLRREGLYASTLQKWRRERGSLEPKKRGPKPNPLVPENKKLQDRVARLEKQLKQANAIIDLQKKVSNILGITLSTEVNENSELE